MEQLTIAGSHEIAEIVTDPYLSGYRVAPQPPGPWLALGGEIADLCPEGWYPEGQWAYARVWSNAAAVAGTDPCLPGPDASPGVFIGQPWTPLPPSHMIRIPLTGCNLEGQSLWRLNIAIKPSDPTLCVSAWIEKGPQKGWPAILIEPAQETASLLIALDPDAPSGSAAVALLSAHPTDATAADLPEPYGADVYSVGVFVP